jgi:hypothetical protein
MIPLEIFAPLLEFLYGFNLIQPFRDNGDRRYVRPVPIPIVEVVKHHRVLVKNVVVVTGVLYPAEAPLHIRQLTSFFPDRDQSNRPHWPQTVVVWFEVQPFGGQGKGAIRTTRTDEAIPP